MIVSVDIFSEDTFFYRFDQNILSYIDIRRYGICANETIFSEPNDRFAYIKLISWAQIKIEKRPHQILN